MEPFYQRATGRKLGPQDPSIGSYLDNGKVFTHTSEDEAIAAAKQAIAELSSNDTLKPIGIQFLVGPSFVWVAAAELPNEEIKFIVIFQNSPKYTLAPEAEIVFDPMKAIINLHKINLNSVDVGRGIEYSSYGLVLGQFPILAYHSHEAARAKASQYTFWFPEEGILRHPKMPHSLAVLMNDKQLFVPAVLHHDHSNMGMLNLSSLNLSSSPEGGSSDQAKVVAARNEGDRWICKPLPKNQVTLNESVRWARE
jgi:hypothetical protein